MRRVRDFALNIETTDYFEVRVSLRARVRARARDVEHLDSYSGQARVLIYSLFLVFIGLQGFGGRGC